MSITDIIKEIEKEKDEKVKELTYQKEEEVLKLKKVYEKKIEEKKEEILKEAQEALDKKILKVEEELKRKEKILILEEKRKLLKELQKSGFEEIKKLDEKTEKIFLEKLVKKAFLETEGILDSEVEIISACQKEKLLKEVLNNFQKKYQFSSECLRSIGGFILKTKNFEIDYTFESFFDKIKEETEIKIAKILFEQNNFH